MKGFHYKVKPALISKQEEFLLLGNDTVSEEDIWEFLLEKEMAKRKA